MTLWQVATAFADAVRTGRVVEQADLYYAPHAILAEGHWSEGGAPLAGIDEIRKALAARDALYTKRRMTVDGPWFTGPITKRSGRFALRFRFELVARDGRMTQEVDSIGTSEVEDGLIVRQDFWLPRDLRPVEPSTGWAATRRMAMT